MVTSARSQSTAEIVRHEVADYAKGHWWKSTAHYLEDAKQKKYSVIVVPDYETPRLKKAGVVVMARIVDNYVIIDEDITDRPLFEELVRAGIPREQIILTYAGESLPKSDDTPPND